MKERRLPVLYQYPLWGKSLSSEKGLTPVVSHLLAGGPSRSVADAASYSDAGILGTDAESL